MMLSMNTHLNTMMLSLNTHPSYPGGDHCPPRAGTLMSHWTVIVCLLLQAVIKDLVFFALMSLLWCKA